MFKKLALGSVAIVVAATTVYAASHAGPHAGAITARKSHMQLYQHNLIILGGMARGNVDYDADAAKAAASNIAALTRMSQAGYWPQGSDAGSVEGTRAMPALWENFPDVMAKAGAVAEAAAQLEATAGDGVEAIQAGVGQLGGACTACHKAYRQE